MDNKPKKLGNSTRITIGSKLYSSYNMPSMNTSLKGVHTSNVSITRKNRNGGAEEDKAPDLGKHNIKTSAVSINNTNTRYIHARIQWHTTITAKPKTLLRRNSMFHGFIRPSSTKASLLANAKDDVQNALNSQNDSGSSTLSTTITAGAVSVKAFKAAQAASPHVVKVAKGTYVAGGNTVRVIRAVNSTIGEINSGTVKLNSQTLMQLKHMAIHHMVNIGPIKRLTSTISNVKTLYQEYRALDWQGVSKAVSGTTRRVIGGGAVAGIRTGFKGLKYSGKGITRGAVGVGDIFSSTDDTGVQAIGLSIKTAHYTSKLIKASPKAFKQGVRTVRTTANTGKSVYRVGKGFSGAVKSFKSIGIKETVRYYQAQALKAAAKAGGSSISAIIHSIKFLGMKFLLPVLLLLLAVVAIVNTANAPVSGISAIFGGAFTNKDTNVDYDAHTFLQGVIESKKDGLVDKIMKIRDKNLVNNGGKYHYVRMFTATDSEEIDITRNNILGAIYTNDELVSLIEPVFQTIMLTKYDLEPTQAQIDGTLNEIWDALIKVTTKQLPTEYCRSKPCSQCGHYHAKVSSCPNIIKGKHKEYTCSTCCYRKKHTDSETGEVSYIEECNGYHYCGGHKILAITINLDGYYELLAKYFTDPIDRLANLPSRTAEQEDELQTLKDNYELCLSYIDIVLDNSGFDMGGTDISGVVFKNGTRPNNDEIISVATMQLGNVGGRTFWSWYGFKSRVEWCATFVSWCENQTGNISAGIAPKFASCREGVKWFKAHSQWAARDYQQPVAGDIIFFDWEGDGSPNHVGLVVGNDGEKVYTIEGNSGDVCRRRCYSLHSSVILGYGLPNYR